MKKLTFLFTLFTLFLMGCEENTEFTLKGKVSGLDSDTLLVYYQVPEYKLDTLIAHQGAFTYTIQPDTFTVFSLMLNDGQMIPVFADKGEMVEWEGSADNLKIKGWGENRLMNDILELTQETPRDSMSHCIDSLLQAHPQSFTSLYLIDNYYRYCQSIDYRKLEEQINTLSGAIKDTPHMMDIQARVEKRCRNLEQKYIFSINMLDQYNKVLNWNRLKDKFILLDFWASWHPQSQAQEDSLAYAVKELKRRPFVAISISLDMDKEAWKKAIAKRDTTQWKQVCELNGWNHVLVRERHIDQLPANILLSPRKEVITENIYGEALVKKVKELMKEEVDRRKKKH